MNRRTTLLAATVAALALLPRLWAADALLTAQDTLRRLQADIEVETIRQVNQQLDPVEFAKQLNLPSPILPPTLAPEEVQKLIDEEVARAVNDEYPIARIDEIKAEADKKFRLYEKGETQTLRLKNRDNEYAAVTAKIYELSETYIVFGDKKIHRDDVYDKDLPHLYRQEHNAAYDDFVTKQSAYFKGRRTDYESQQRRKITYQVWRQSGYVKLRGQNIYVPLSTYFSAKLERQRRDMESTVQQSVKLIYMSKNGWSFDEEAKDWVPRTGDVNGPDVKLLTRLQSFLRDVVRKVLPPSELEPAPAGEAGLDLWGDSPAAGPKVTRPAADGSGIKKALPSKADLGAAAASAKDAASAVKGIKVDKDSVGNALGALGHALSASPDKGPSPNAEAMKANKAERAKALNGD